MMSTASMFSAETPPTSLVGTKPARIGEPGRPSADRRGCAALCEAGSFAWERSPKGGSVSANMERQR